MALRAMPFVIVNLGGEMLYILEQRLRAQSIPPEKAVKVLHDVVKTMFSSKFVAEVFKPAVMYSATSTRQIFERLAHSSIMRLSESSMDKLYDLMTMGLKYQLIACRHAADILEVTLNHVGAIRDCINDPAVIELVDSCEHMLNLHYKSFMPGDWMQLRQSLVGFFHNKRVKVSLFLQEGLQVADGRIALPPTLPDASYQKKYGALGMVKMLGPGGAHLSSHLLKLAQSASVADHPVRLGGNLYAKDRVPVKRPRGGADGEHDAAASAAAALELSSNAALLHNNAEFPASPPASSTAAPPFASGSMRHLASFGDSGSSFSFEMPDRGPPRAYGGSADELWQSGGGEGKQELNLLASLIGPAGGGKADNFKFNINDLFGGPELDPRPTAALRAAPKGAKDDTIVIDPTHTRDRGLTDIMRSFDIGGAAKNAEDDGSDLLDLMDGL